MLYMHVSFEVHTIYKQQIITLWIIWRIMDTGSVCKTFSCRFCQGIRNIKILIKNI